MAKKTATSASQLEGYMIDMFGGQLGDQLLSAAQKVLFNAAGRINTKIKANPPWKNKSGALSKSLRRQRQGKVNVRMYSKAPQAKWLYEGTKAHFVAPTSGGLLSWSSNGTRFFSRGHMVSGVWGGGSGTIRDTPANAPQKEWWKKGWIREQDKTIKKITKALVAEVGL
jgi:hypothetical protein